MSLLPKADFINSGDRQTLLATFVYLDFSFMCWVLLGPLAIQISQALHLSDGDKGLMVSVPVLAGAFLRVLNGLLADHYGAKQGGIFAQLFVICGLALAWLFGVPDFAAVLLVGVVLGMAGASFAIALPMTSRCYPPEHQGKALGVVGAGNLGTVFAALLAPPLGLYFGWVNVFGMAALVMCGVLVFFILFTRPAPVQPQRRKLTAYLQVLRLADSWWFMLFYGVSFGGFVGLAASLSIYFHTQYGLAAVPAGYAVAACVFVGSIFRPIGGWVADRFGGAAVLSILYAVAAAMLALVALGLPTLPLSLAAFVLAMLALGTGNGAVFQLVPLRFGREIGVMTGLVGCAGGVGGFYLAASLGYSKQWTGSYQDAFLIFAGLTLAALVGVNVKKKHWRANFMQATSEPLRVRI